MNESLLSNALSTIRKNLDRQSAKGIIEEQSISEIVNRIQTSTNLAEAVRNADLAIEEQAIRVTCLSCGAESEASANRLLCAACGDYRTRLVSGDEMLLMSVELERRENVRGIPNV